jgi:hypothetical protein
MVTHDKANGGWELQSLMRCDELVDMGCLVPMKYFLKTTYYYKAILNLQSQSHNTKQNKKKKVGKFPKGPLLGHYAKAKP